MTARDRRILCNAFMLNIGDGLKSGAITSEDVTDIKNDLLQLDCSYAEGLELLNDIIRAIKNERHKTDAEL